MWLSRAYSVELAGVSLSLPLLLPPQVLAVSNLIEVFVIISKRSDFIQGMGSYGRI